LTDKIFKRPHLKVLCGLSAMQAWTLANWEVQVWALEPARAQVDI